MYIPTVALARSRWLGPKGFPEEEEEEEKEASSPQMLRQQRSSYTYVPTYVPTSRPLLYQHREVFRAQAKYIIIARLISLLAGNAKESL